MTPFEIALTVMLTGFVGMYSPRWGWAFIAMDGVIYLWLGWTPFQGYGQ